MAAITNLTQLSAIPTSAGMSKLKNHWTFAFENETLKYKIHELFRKNIFVVPIEEITLPSSKLKEDFKYVEWNGGLVISAQNRIKPYSSGFSTCIALLARGYLKGKNQPKLLGLAHIMSLECVENCTNILREIQKEISDGRIEVFIAGGYAISKDLYDSMYGQIMKFAEEKKCDIDVSDDQFRVADIREIDLVTVENRGHHGTKSLSFAGFDKENNPFGVLGVHFRTFDEAKEKYQCLVYKKC